MDENRTLDMDDEPVGQSEETKRITRVLKLVNLISNAPRRWTRRALSERLEISERQLDKDFQLLRHGLHCELLHTREGYYFARLPDLPPVGYTTPEALALITALQFARDSGALDQTSLASAMADTCTHLRHRAGPQGTVHKGLVSGSIWCRQISGRNHCYSR